MPLHLSHDSFGKTYIMIQTLTSLKKLLAALLITALFLTSCTKEVETPIVSSTGTITFWSNQNGSKITVKINGGSYSGNITSYYSSSTSVSCSASGCYSETLLTGVTYTYTATDGTHNWSGNFSLSGSCKTLLLYW